MTNGSTTAAASASASAYGSIDIVNYGKEDIVLLTNDYDATTQQQQKAAPWSKVIVAATLLLATAVVAIVSTSSNDTTATATNTFGLQPILGDSLLSDDTESEEPVQQGPFFYRDARVDHFDDANTDTWPNLYYTSDTYFRGPGHPIFVIIGGEGPVENILYPFVAKRLAKDSGGFVLQTEHRFYGSSQPVGMYPSNEDMKKYLSPEQALADWVQLIQYTRSELGCDLSSSSSSSATYCPVITIGGSYPGFLSAMMRFVYPDIVDIGYASSAPLHLYEHLPGFDTNGYYDKVSVVADEASPGCADGVASTLEAVHAWVMESSTASPIELAEQLGICTATFPEYIATHEILARELTMMVVASNADFNMDYYPPTADTDLVQSCQIFSQDSTTALERYATFLQYKKSAGEEDNADSSSSSSSEDATDNTCFDLMTEIATGPNATLSSADWSGAGDGENGRMWEFQICKDLVVMTGTAGPDSMFRPKRPWTMEWLTEHCQSRFDVSPQPGRMREMWNFDHLENASRILFTNGLKDGWSVSSYLEDVVPNSVVALNFPNGAHHSDLSHMYPVPGETTDIEEGHEEIAALLGHWLIEIAKE